MRAIFRIQAMRTLAKTSSTITNLKKPVRATALMIIK